MTTDTPQPTRAGTRMLSPAAMIGAGVLLASLGAAAGWMIHADRSRGAAPEAAALALAPEETVVTPAAAAQKPQPVQQPSVARPAAPAQHATAARHSPPVRGDTPSGTQHTSDGSASSTPVQTQRVATCDSCGVVEGVRSFQRKGEGSGVGAVAGGVLGGVLGRQVGGGHGRDAMTVLGAVGGGLAGHEVEKRAKSETLYEVRVRMDDGSLRTLTQHTAPSPGARVVVEGSSLRTLSSQGADPAMVNTSGQGT